MKVKSKSLIQLPKDYTATLSTNELSATNNQETLDIEASSLKENIDSRDTRTSNDLPLCLLNLLRNCVVVSSFVYLGFLDWTILAMVYASCYWHLLNAYHIGFSYLSVTGLVLAFIVIPMSLRITSLRCFLSTPKGRVVEAFLTCSFLACGLQIQETVRTMFFAFAMGLSCNRLSLPSRIEAETYSLTGGLFLLLCSRSLCWSLHPFDFSDSWIIPAILPLLGFTCSLIIAYEEYLSQYSHCYVNISEKTTSHQSCLKDRNYQLSKNCSGLLETPTVPYLYWLYGVASTIMLPAIMFLVAMILTSDAVIPRWTSSNPVTSGYVIILLLGVGWLFQTFTRQIPSILFPFMKRSKQGSEYEDNNSDTTFDCNTVYYCIKNGFIVVSIILFTIGGVLFIANQRLADSTSLFGGYLFVLTLPTIMDIAINSYKGFNLSLCPFLAISVAAFHGIWMIGGFIVSVAWFVGPEVPLIGRSFWGNVPAIWLGSFISLVLAATVLVVVSLISVTKYPFFQKSPSMIESALVRKNNLITSPDINNCCPEEYVKERQMKSSIHLSYSIGIIWFLMMTCLYLPSLRSRISRYVERGSRVVPPHFTSISFNIQQGYSLPNHLNPGFSRADRIIEIDSKFTPNVWGIQESDPTNLLNMNRDWISYLADSMRTHSFHGAPSWVPTPGVALLTTEKLIDPTYVKLPRGKEPLERLVSWGIYEWQKSPGSTVLANIIVAVTHLSAFNVEARQLQLEKLSEIIAEKWSENPVVLLGDFNNFPVNTTKIWDNDSLVLPKGKLRLVDATSSTPTETTNGHRIDHIYYKGLCVEEFGVIHTPGISDHLPVIAKFSLPDGNKCSVTPIRIDTVVMRPVLKSANALIGIQ